MKSAAICLSVAFGVASQVHPCLGNVQQHGALGGRACGLRDLDAFLGALAIVGHGHVPLSPLDHQRIEPQASIQ